jgi:murein L,D-transpeptidase YafK
MRSLIISLVFFFPALALGQESLPKADIILVIKSKRQMHLLREGKILKSYQISLGPNSRGHKQRQGDKKTPEGRYKICGRNPNSHYHKSLRISYPNAQDREQAKKRGVDPGGDIMIHGLGKKFGFLGKSHTLHDWTLGCIAVTNQEIEEIWKMVDVGTEISIK